jgi:hypothetical protein
MTQSSARDARIHLISEGVVASYIHDISARGSVAAPPAAARRRVDDQAGMRRASGARRRGPSRDRRRPLARVRAWQP